MSTSPKVAVIIPAYNETDVIDDCLRSLSQQTYPSFQAFVVNDMSQDDTAEKIRQWAQQFPSKISLREFGKVGPGKARNLVAQEVAREFEIFAFMDADCMATPAWLSELVQGFERSPDICSVGGPNLAHPSSSPFQRNVDQFFRMAARLVDFYKGDEEQERLVRHNPLCNVAYKRDAFLKMNGFRTDLFPGEDFELDDRLGRAGHKILFTPKAVVYHHRPEDLERFRKVMKSYGRSQGILVRERGPHRLIHWLGFLAILALPLTALLSRLPLGQESLAAIGLSSLRWIEGFTKGLLVRSKPFATAF